jgi:hypothetical protein
MREVPLTVVFVVFSVNDEDGLSKQSLRLIYQR